VGLDAVVYRNKRHLNLALDEKFALLLPETGEVYFESYELSRKYRDQCRATSHRLGNMSLVSFLREEATRLVGLNSMVVQRVLYSGTHSGDTIAGESIHKLAAELESIRETKHLSPEFRLFLPAMDDLISAAKREGNPIVFV
jgi:hypothetical protein